MGEAPQEISQRKSSFFRKHTLRHSKLFIFALKQPPISPVGPRPITNSGSLSIGHGQFPQRAFIFIMVVMKRTLFLPRIQRNFSFKPESKRQLMKHSTFQTSALLSLPRSAQRSLRNDTFSSQTAAERSRLVCKQQFVYFHPRSTPVGIDGCAITADNYITTQCVWS